MEAWFKFKGVDSRDMGILISAMPDIVKPKRRETEVTIPGRNGVLTIDDGCYEGYSLTIECGRRGSDRLSEIGAWLDGRGELILSTEPDKVYKARISNSIAVSDVVYLYNSFLVEFSVFPLKYSVNQGGEAFTLTAPAAIHNKGTVYSEPKITIYGTRDIALRINSTWYLVYGVDGYITIDSELQEVFKDSANANNKLAAGDFPRFETGENDIMWMGNVERIEIEPRWRFL